MKVHHHNSLAKNGHDCGVKLPRPHVCVQTTWRGVTCRRCLAARKANRRGGV